MKKVEVKSKRYISCPNCGKGEHTIEHLFEGAEKHGKHFYESGYWGCDECNFEFKVRAFEDGNVQVDVRKKKWMYKSLDLLKLDTESIQKEGGLYMLIEGLNADKNNKIDPKKDLDYFFHSHQCPTNLMRKVLDVYTPGYGIDPHGIWRWVSSIPAPKGYNRFRNENPGRYEDLLKMMKTDGAPQPTGWLASMRGM